MGNELFELNPEQKKAFERLKKAYKDCEKLNVLFYNNYGTIGAVDKSKIVDYNDDESGILDKMQNSKNEFKSIDSWADDRHFFQVNPKLKKSYESAIEGFEGFLPKGF